MDQDKRFYRKLKRQVKRAGNKARRQHLKRDLADNPEEARPFFQALRSIRDRLIARGVAESMLTELSMGMSDDFEVAVEEGATLIRVGTAIFGSRTPP